MYFVLALISVVSNPSEQWSSVVAHTFLSISNNYFQRVFNTYLVFIDLKFSETIFFVISFLNFLKSQIVNPLHFKILKMSGNDFSFFILL